MFPEPGVVRAPCHGLEFLGSPGRWEVTEEEARSCEKGVAASFRCCGNTGEVLVARRVQHFRNLASYRVSGILIFEDTIEVHGHGFVRSHVVGVLVVFPCVLDNSHYTVLRPDKDFAKVMSTVNERLLFRGVGESSKNDWRECIREGTNLLHGDSGHRRLASSRADNQACRIQVFEGGLTPISAPVKKL